MPKRHGFSFDSAELRAMAERVLARAKRGGASGCECDVSEAHGLTVTVRKGKPDTIEHNRDRSVAVTVYFGERPKARRGHASTSDLSPAALEQTVDAALAIARHTAEDDCAGLPDAELLAREQPELDLFHPALSLAQTMVDPTDPLNYVRQIATEPRAGFEPKSVLMTEGVNADGTGDSYAPPHGIEVQAVALGLPPQNPIIHPIAELAWGDLSPITIPPAGLSGNLANGKASGVLAQWTASDASDGHYVIYDIPAAMDQAAGFVENLMNDPVGLVPAP